MCALSPQGHRLTTPLSLQYGLDAADSALYFLTRRDANYACVVEHLRWSRSYAKIAAREIWNIHTFYLLLRFLKRSLKLRLLFLRFFWLLQHPFRTVSERIAPI